MKTNPLKPDPNDPKWTAFVLGELSDDEQRAMQKILSDHPELQKEIEAIRETSDLIEQEFTIQPEIVLNEPEPNVVNLDDSVVRSPRVISFWNIAGLTSLGAAACWLAVSQFQLLHQEPLSSGETVPEHGDRLEDLALNVVDDSTAVVVPMSGEIIDTLKLKPADSKSSDASTQRLYSPDAYGVPESQLNQKPDAISEQIQTVVSRPVVGGSYGASGPEMAALDGVSVEMEPVTESMDQAVELDSSAAISTGMKYESLKPMLPPGLIVGGDRSKSVRGGSVRNKTVRDKTRRNRSTELSTLSKSSSSVFGVAPALSPTPVAQAVSRESKPVTRELGSLGTELNSSLASPVAAEGYGEGVPRESGMAARYGLVASVPTSVSKPTVASSPRLSAISNYASGSINEEKLRRLSSPTSYGYGDMDSLQSIAVGRESYRRQTALSNSESYQPIIDNAFLKVKNAPLSTFSIDVDTASYANMRRFLNSHTLPPVDSVRIEELLNYFEYDYPESTGEDPFHAQVETAGCPWQPAHRLVRIGIQGKHLDSNERIPTNLVFLIDVSGSMRPENKLPLLQRAMKLLVNELTEDDLVAIVVYAGASGLVLEPTSGDRKQVILAALDRLKSGGSTTGGAGIQLAYGMAMSNFIKGGVNRVILATDGDFNVGITNRGDLTRLVQEKAQSGVFLTALGFGMGNIKDATLEELTNKGNGNYSYIDRFSEAKKVLVDQKGGTLVTLAKDVKIQIEFNPGQVQSYRLIGYENRKLAAEDFNDDRKDAGEIGAGHSVTALYEVVPVGVSSSATGASIPALKYQKNTPTLTEIVSDELLTLKLRYKQPDGDISKLLEIPVLDSGKPFNQSSVDFRFAAAVGSFGMILRNSPHKGNATMGLVYELAQEGLGDDEKGYRAGFLDLVKKADSLMGGELQFTATGDPESDLVFFRGVLKRVVELDSLKSKTLLEAIRSQKLDAYANLKKVELRRVDPASGRTQKMVFNVKELLEKGAGSGQDILLQNNDVITINQKVFQF